LPLKIGGRNSGLALRTGKITHADEFTGFVGQSQDDALFEFRLILK
jgi:hypothetical protein